jgi:hypothetical protein
MAKLSKTEKIRRALKKNPDANPKELAEKIGIHSSAVYTARKKLAAENGEAPKPWARRRKKARVDENVVFLKATAPDKFKSVERPATVTMSSGTNVLIPSHGPPLVSQVAAIEAIGPDRVRAILGLLES